MVILRQKRSLTQEELHLSEKCKKLISCSMDCDYAFNEYDKNPTEDNERKLNAAYSSFIASYNSIINSYSRSSSLTDVEKQLLGIAEFLLNSQFEIIQE